MNFNGANLNEILKNLIEEKYNEIAHFKQSGIFEKINDFEANAVGQVGEKFVKMVFENLGIEMQDFGEVIHDEFDICLKDGTKIEIKTARKGLKNNTFQFNGINPNYNCKYIICIGLSAKAAFFKIVSGEKIYNHKTRKFYLNVGGKQKQIVAMNPHNLANFKLTLSLKDLEPIEDFERRLREIFG